MNNYKVSDHFYIAELVSKDILEKWDTQAIRFMDSRMIAFLEYQRSQFGTTTVNNWYEGGSFDSRGFRSPNDATGAKFSQHRYGRATDTSYEKATAEEVRQYMKDNWELIYKPMGITRVEDDVTWLHADMQWEMNQQSLIFVPVPKT